MKKKIKEINIGKRFREEKGNIKELAESIEKLGQIVPIIIDENNNLIDGERRIEALKILNVESVECVEYGE